MIKGIVKSRCGICKMGCGILVFMENGRPARIVGDPDHMVNKGTLCSKSEAALQFLYPPDRFKVPLKRTGKRGEGKWEEVTSERALDLVAAQLKGTKDRFGPESVVFIRGGSKGLQEDYLTRFGNLFGCPNISSMAHTFASHREGTPLRLPMATNRGIACKVYPASEGAVFE